MHINNVNDVVPVLRSRLREYISIKLGEDANAQKIRCFVHNDNDPSMRFNHKNGDETIKCFSCGWSGDIFACASFLDNLPSSGSEWITETIPALCKELDVELQYSEPTLADKEKAKQYRLCQDIYDIMAEHTCEDGYQVNPYIVERNWEQDQILVCSIPEEKVKTKLLERGWPQEIVATTTLISNGTHLHWFGEDRVTFVIKNHLNKPIAFVYRPENPIGKLKYFNSSTSPIYSKSATLLGLEIAKKYLRKDGLFIVEGPGDLFQLYRLGIYNAVATCGVALTAQHLALLKTLGCTDLKLCFDWDDGGVSNTYRILRDVVKEVPGVGISVVLPPTEVEASDPDQLLKGTDDSAVFLGLETISGFNWQIDRLSDNMDPATVCEEMIPSIACEPAAVKREMLITTLSNHTGISDTSITSDVESIRNKKYEEKLNRLTAQVEYYTQVAKSDPDNITAYTADLERSIEKIEKDYDSSSSGPIYQMSRYLALQEKRASRDSNYFSFEMNYFPAFKQKLDGGQSWASGVVFYFGGRANSGKTATTLFIGCDVALSDPDAIVIFHSTDDNYDQIEPRIKSNIYHMTNSNLPELSIGMLVQPFINMPKRDDFVEGYKHADVLFRKLLQEERIVILDAEDGNTLSVLENNVRRYRKRFPNKKIMLVCDNTHNYTDYPALDQTRRMTNICTHQKYIAAKYKCCMIATAEYRKNLPQNTDKIVFPIDDDLADARAFTYRPSGIVHVYNDLHDRQDNADIIWTDGSGRAYPRLLLLITKNKVSSFKGKLCLDLHPQNIFLTEVDAEVALWEATEFNEDKANNAVRLANGNITAITKEATEYEAAM